MGDRHLKFHELRDNLPVHFERLVGGQGIRDAINGGGGWALLLDGVAKVAADQR